MKFIDPRIDFAFKKIFGSEDAKDILISFLESLLGLDGDRRIADVTILDPFLAPKIKEFKYSVLDIKCRDHRGISYIVEMQIQKAVAFLKRIQYNAAKAYVNQIENGEDYPKLNHLVAITITDFPLFDGFGHCVSRHESRETVTGHSYLMEVLHYFIELPKFDKPLEELTDVLDLWIYFIKFAGSLEAIPDKLRVEPIRHAFEKAMVANMSAEEYEMYEKAGIAITDARGAILLAREEGRQEGERTGERKGRQEGRQEGEATMLLRLLQRRFGSLPGWASEKVRSVDQTTLETWGDRVFEAKTLDEVFAERS
ncbi:MAG: Rpn family recombination-promoting nuclease/putative transposase [Magnetococcales bacterium]|nr:Rpn family recombination-promoting nuclease/putative transposase [Magnetococcales bacterium]